MPRDRTSSVLTAQRAPPAQNSEDGEPRRASVVGGVVRVRTTHRGISSSVPGGTQGLEGGSGSPIASEGSRTLGPGVVVLATLRTALPLVQSTSTQHGTLTLRYT